MEFQALGCVFISWGCCYKVPQTWWLKTTEIVLLTTVWRPEVQTKGVGSVSLPLEALRILSCLFYLLGAGGIPGLFLAASLKSLGFLWWLSW